MYRTSCIFLGYIAGRGKERRMGADKYKYLMEELRTLEESEENQSRKNKWGGLQHTSRDQWRCTPKTDGSSCKGETPVQFDCNSNFWSGYLGYDVGEYYQNPEVFLENHLKMKIQRFKLFHDDVFLEKNIPIWMGSGFEASLIGMNICYAQREDPWIDFQYFLEDESSLEKIPEFDFYKTGQMPNAVRIYEFCMEMLEDDFNPIFPEWERGPFGVATYARGYEDVLIDMATEDEFADIYMDFFTNRQIQYFEAREKYLGKGTQRINLYNDEVNTPTISPGLYEQYILPYEQKLAEKFGGLNYWHSCGKLDALLPSICKIPEIEMIHKGPWTSASVIGKVFGQKCAIEVCLNPEKDVNRQDKKGMYQAVSEIVHDLNQQKVKGYNIRANNISMLGESVEKTVAKGKTFIEAARCAIFDGAV